MKKKGILCIDDEAMILESLKEQIESNFGNELIYETAENAEEALEVLEDMHNNGVDILVMVSDWLMPGMKGDEFLVEAHKTFPAIIPIMLTGHATPEAIANAQQNANLFSCINKPWSENELVSTIRNAMRQFENQQDTPQEVILCVDDEDIILNALKDQLEDSWGEKYIIETAADPREALELFDELIEEGLKVPVIISDYMMPGMKGDELLREIHKKSPETHKILLTGHANLEGVTNAINNAKLYRFIAKPWEKEDLSLTIKEAIRSFFQEREIKEKNAELEKLNASLEEKVKLRTAELEYANATKDKFFSIIGHDLKGSFNSLIGFSEILIEDFDELDTEGKLNFLNRIKGLSEKTYSLLQNLLEWARMQTGQITHNTEFFDIGYITQDTIEMQKHHADSKKITLSSDIPEDLYVFADKNMISTTIRNLISNALKFTQEGGEVKVTMALDKRNVSVQVRDTGIGMTPEKLSKLFKISEKVKTYGTAKEEGTGLGLILCKEFVEKNKGKMSVTSEQGKGSCFSFTVPAKAEALL